jgi:hypothetical protein
MTVSRTLRYQVLRRDGFTCRYCGGKVPADDVFRYMAGICWRTLEQRTDEAARRIGPG